jgi:phosphoglucosamine mutase
LRTAQVEAISAGVIPTPGVAYLTSSQGFDLGIVISASHNPFQDNGIKFFSPSGRKLSEADEERLEAALLVPYTDINIPPIKAAPMDTTLLGHYYSFLRDEIAAGLSLQGMKIALDCANGAAFSLAPRLLTELGADLQVFAAQPNGQNINEQCGSLHMDNLGAMVQEHICQLGIAFDGDADRVLFLDGEGRLVNGDGILFLMAEHYLQHNILNPKLVVATVMSNLGLEVALAERGITLRRAAVGDKYVLDELLATDGVIGGEQSGHIIFPRISLAGDGLITALQVLKVIVEQCSNLETLIAKLPYYPQVLINVVVKSKPPFSTIPAIQTAVEELTHKLAGRGRLLLRYSGTENLARVMIEGENQAVITAQADYLAGIISSQLG